MIAADTLTDDQIRLLCCATCARPAVCVGRYEDMPEPGEPACNDCCGHACEDGKCEAKLDNYDGPPDGEAWSGGFAENH